MRRNIYFFFFLLMLAFVSGCGVRPIEQPPLREHLPTIDVGLFWGRDSISFSTDSSCRFSSPEGDFLTQPAGDRNWQARVVNPRPAVVVYRLVAASFSTLSSAKREAERLRSMGFDSEASPIGSIRRVGRYTTSNGTFYRVILKKRFATKEEAQIWQDSLSNKINTFVIREVVRPALGTIVAVCPETGTQIESKTPMVISGRRITLRNVPVGQGYHWARSEERQYPGEIILRVGEDGTLTVINRIEIETYLQGVVPAEMPAGFPLEALKAQAVAARSEVLAKLGRAHVTDPFDVCADVHCQAYAGLSKRAAATDRAVRETRGQVLVYNDEVVDAVYSAVCGGHGESSSSAWGGESLPYLEGHYDGPGRLKRYGDLSREENIRRWINADPVAACNSDKGQFLSALEYTRKYFRWQDTLSQTDLRASLKRFSGQEVGAILDLIPLRRGESGRISHLKVQGTDRSYIIKKELNIRKALSESTIWSSCFYVDTVRSGTGAPRCFILHGAGFGHGVGMCQTGAAGLALRGSDYRSILYHYYQGTRIRRIY